MNNQYILTSDGELYHWKYIKRVWRNGRWQYEYPNDKYGIKNFIDTKITGKAYKQHAGEAVSAKMKAGNKLFKTTQDRIHAEQTSKMYSPHDPKVVNLKTKEKQLRAESNRADKDYTYAVQKYYNSTLAGFAESAINAGRSKVSSALRKLADKVGQKHYSI